ncbi:MAG: VCBS repeat-containing protein, partial [Cyclobacteriaceae bacterium]|nr:VCBS repeat-containing protein [Cyclobacteriaceae bacterium]
MGIIPLLFVLLSGCKTKNESGKNNASFEKLTFEYTAVDTSAPFNPWAKFSGDLDKDGMEDIIIGGQKGPLVWYKYPDWSKYLIAEGGYNTVDGEVGDLDGDGDLDIIMGGLFWYENNGNILEDPALPWKIHLIA